MSTSNHPSRGAFRIPRTPTTVGIVVLFVCSIFFALYGSNAAYTSDEVWSVKVASLNYGAGMEILQGDIHPPLYYEILRPWMHLFGTGERAARGLSGLCYILSVFGIFGIGRDLYGSKTGLLCATLYLASPLAILSAQFARMYALLTLLSVLSTWLYFEFSIKPRDSRVMLILYVGVNVIGTFTHIAFFFVLFGQIVFHLSFYRRVRMKRFIVAVVLSLVPYTVLWSPVLLTQIANSKEGLAWLNRPGLLSFVELLFLYGGNFWLLVPVLAYFWWRTGFEPFSRFTKISLSSLPLWLLAVTVLVPFLVSQVKPVFNPRFAVIGLPFFALSIGALVGKATNYLLPSALIVLTGIGLVVLHPGSAICDNRAIAVHLSQSAKDGDVVIFTSLTRLPIDYYLERVAQPKRLLETSFPAEIDQHPGYEGRIRDQARKAALESEAQALADKIAAMQSYEPGRRVFFLHGFRPDIDSIFERQLRRRFQLVSGEELQCNDVSFYFKEMSVYK